MPRQRSARAAVLGSSVRRSPTGSYSSRGSSVVRRRTTVIVLVLLSLALITVYFRESNGGELHSIQSTGATILRPFQVGAERVARPFRDAYGYASGLVHAKSQNAKLRRQVESLRQQVIQNESAAAENAQLKALLGYREGATFPNDFDAVAARVIARPPSIYEQQVVIAAGSRAGVRLHDSVVTGEGLVGQVTDVTPTTAKVTLLTDETSAVSAVDIHSHASGLVRHGAGAGGALILDRVTKDQVVDAGDSVVTAGWRLGKLSSIYPGGIPIGRVTSVGQTDTDLYKQIQVSPYVDFGSLESVLVLVPKQARAGR